jgi:hypothetical protein
MASDESKKVISTVNIFASEPWFLPHVKNAIFNMELPWQCSEDLIMEVKNAALEACVNGWSSHEVMNKLVPVIFKTKRDAKWAFTSLTIAGMSAVTYAQLKMIGEKYFKWSYLHIPNSCIYENHLKRDGKKYKIDSIDWPASKYLCRCMAQIIS